MFENSWNVLLVDDEPDVLSVSKLALKKMRVFDLPLKIYTAPSKKDGLELIKSEFTSSHGKASTLAVALIDVVMETDTAGLDLCKYIREDQKNHLTQLYVRTGQPGIAPERLVIDKYDISGYISKAEATEDKLYTIFKSGINQFYWSRVALWLSNSLSGLINASGSKKAINNAIHDSLKEFFTNKSGDLNSSYDVRVAVKVDDNITAINMDTDVSKFIKESEYLKSKQSIPLSNDGDKLFYEGNKFLFSIAPRANAASVEALAYGGFLVPQYLITSGHIWLKAVGSFWCLSKA